MLAAELLPLFASSHLTVPFARPAISVFGRAVAGRAGKASVPAAEEEGAAGERVKDGRRDEEEDEEEAAEGLTQGVGPTRPAPVRLADEAGRGGMVGNGLDLAALPQLPCLDTAERDDWAVEDFSLRTRNPPLRGAVPVASGGVAVEDPGRTG